MRPKIKETLESIKNEYLQKLESDLTNEINVIQETLNKVLKEKEKLSIDYDKMKKEILEKIELWKTLINKIDAI